LIPVITVKPHIILMFSCALKFNESNWNRGGGGDDDDYDENDDGGGDVTMTMTAATTTKRYTELITTVRELHTLKNCCS